MSKKHKATQKPSYFAHPTAIVEPRARIGKGAKIWHFAHVRRGARVGKNTKLGKGVYVDTNVHIGDNVKIANGVSVYQGVTIDDEVMIGPNATFTNDRYPRAFAKRWKIAPTHVGRGASVGANATIVCGVELGPYAMVSAGAVITRSLPAHGLVMGNPAKLVGFVCRCGHRLDTNGQVLAKGRSSFRCTTCRRAVRIAQEALAQLPLLP